MWRAFKCSDASFFCNSILLQYIWWENEFYIILGRQLLKSYGSFVLTPFFLKNYVLAMYSLFNLTLGEGNPKFLFFYFSSEFTHRDVINGPTHRHVNMLIHPRVNTSSCSLWSKPAMRVEQAAGSAGKTGRLLCSRLATSLARRQRLVLSVVATASLFTILMGG